MASQSASIAPAMAFCSSADAFVKRSLPPDGWFKFSRDGKTVGHDAWLIVQHSPDEEFQRKVVRAMAPLVKAGEASGRVRSAVRPHRNVCRQAPAFWQSGRLQGRQAHNLHT